MEFLFLFIYRAVSGAQNGLGYARHKMLGAATLAMILLNHGFLVYIILHIHPPVGLIIASAALVVASMASAVMVDLSFKHTGRIFDIHFWESVTTGAVTLAAVIGGGNVLLIAASVYPALILHKGFINLGGGLKWWDQRTDDETGKTFRIPLFNISIPRSGNVVRITLSILSIILLGLCIAYGWSFHLVKGFRPF